MLSVCQLQINPGQTLMYSDGFRNLIENHCQYLKKHSSTNLIQVDAQVADKYMGDFYQLLQYYNINQELFWITMRVNNLLSPLDYDGQPITIYVPASSMIHQLLNRYLNSTQLS